MNKPSILAGLIAQKGNAIPQADRDIKPAQKNVKSMNLKLNEEEYERLREAAYKSRKSMKAIFIEGMDMWIEKNI
jgi:hypothetical protein